jgi:hypothetical protein
MIQLINLMLNDWLVCNTYFVNELLIPLMTNIYPLPGIYILDNELKNKWIEFSNDWNAIEYFSKDNILDSELISETLSLVFNKVFDKGEINKEIALVAVIKTIKGEIIVLSSLIIFTNKDFNYVLKALDTSILSYVSINDINKIESIIIRFKFDKLHVFYNLEDINNQ